MTSPGTDREGEGSGCHVMSWLLVWVCVHSSSEISCTCNENWLLKQLRLKLKDQMSAVITVCRREHITTIFRL